MFAKVNDLIRTLALVACTYLLVTTAHGAIMDNVMCSVTEGK